MQRMNLVSLLELYVSRSSFYTWIMLSQQGPDRFLRETTNEETEK